MMNRRILYTMVALCASGLAVGCDKFSAERSAQPPLTADYLAGSQWGPEEGPDAMGKHLEFRKDGTYLDRWVGPGGCFYTGTFTVSKEGVILTKTGRQECVDKIPYISTCTVQPAPGSPTYSVKLVCGKNGHYYRHDSLVPAGSAVIISGVQAVATGPRKAASADDIMVRERPAVSAKASTFRVFCEGAERIEKYFRKGYGLIVLARTRDKARVASWENYWYYVSLEGGDCIQPENKRGWVFGEFVRFKEK